MKKILYLCILCIFIGGFAMPATAAEEDEITITPFTSTSLGSKTIKANNYGYFTNSGYYYNILKNSTTATFTVNLSSSASVEIGFYHYSTDTYYSIYSGTVSSRTIRYTPASDMYGCYYVKNKTTGSISITSSSMSN